MNKLLERQIKKAFGTLEAAPKILEKFLVLVEGAYSNFNDDKAMLERSLEISSKEHIELNTKIKEESEKLKTNFIELERMNKLMVDRELKMIELKKEIEELKRKMV